MDKGKMVKITFKVKLGTVNDQKTMNLIRVTVDYFNGTFDLFHEDETGLDRMTIEFGGWNHFENFMHSDAFKLIQRLKPISGTYPLR